MRPFHSTIPAFIGRIAATRPARLAYRHAFRAYAQALTKRLSLLDPVIAQERTLRSLVAKATKTQFGRDHRFEAISSVAEFQRNTPVREYEELLADYLRPHHPNYDNLTWPGRIPYIALTSGTTSGESKFIPVSRDMIRSNQVSVKTLLAFYAAQRPETRFLDGRIFMLGGSIDDGRQAADVFMGDLSGIAARTIGPWASPFVFPPPGGELDSDWNRRLNQLALCSLSEPITVVSGVTSCLVSLFQRVLELCGRASVSEAWPELELVIHGGMRSDPYLGHIRSLLGSSRVKILETYSSSEGFIAVGDLATGLLRLLFDNGIFYEFVPVEEIGSPRPTRHWMGNVQTGVDYAIVVSTCAGLWAHAIGDTIRFESLSPPLLKFTGRVKDQLSAFGEHIGGEEIDVALAKVLTSTGATLREWHAGPDFTRRNFHHIYLIEFINRPHDLATFRGMLDDQLARNNAHYRWFRDNGGVTPPSLIAAKPGAFDAWMLQRRRLSGQHKFPRLDNTGSITGDLLSFLKVEGWLGEEV